MRRIPEWIALALICWGAFLLLQSEKIARETPGGILSGLPSFLVLLAGSATVGIGLLLLIIIWIVKRKSESRGRSNITKLFDDSGR
jgi:hypothetical protein